MEQKTDYVVVNIPTVYTYSPPYSVPPSPVVYSPIHSPPYSLPPSPTNDSSSCSSPTNYNPLIYNHCMPADIPINYVKSNYSNLSNLSNRRKLNSKHLCNHSIYEKKDLIIIEQNDNNPSLDIEKDIRNDYQEENNENNTNYKNQSKLSNYTRTFRNFIGKKHIFDNDNKEYV